MTLHAPASTLPLPFPLRTLPYPPATPTLAAPSAATTDGDVGEMETTFTVQSPRITVLPRVEWNGTRTAIVTRARPRFEPVRSLGEGGVGEVVLVHDHDIDRDVAIKRLQPRFGDAASLMRFADEVRVVGKLDHPNIAPIHDVGVDESGRPYFLMKYVEGETLERVLERLSAGDPAYVARFSFEVRIHIFRGILRALQYAHARGIVHRDIKPSNVMIGPFGEVVLMDWGIVKQSGPACDATQDAHGEVDDTAQRARLFATRQGELVGTPAYMSPEQARGDNAAVDERSDIYSACALLYELMTLEHYLASLPYLESVPAVIAAIVAYEPSLLDTVRAASRTGAPVQYLHMARHGMQNDPALRFQSVDEILARLQANDDGQTPVECPVTLMKRVGGESARFLDRHPVASTAGVVALLSATLAGLAMAATHFLPFLAP